MLSVADINTLWRIKPFEALSRLCPVTGLSPRRWCGADPECLASAAPSLPIARIGLPPGWASRLATLSAPRILRRIRTLGSQGLFVTSPHYLPLVRLAVREMPVYYYCSDDYSTYEGWGGTALELAEAELIRHCRRSFFVSRVLAEKAIRKLGADPSRVSVSPNATSGEFLKRHRIADHPDISTLLGPLRRPILGVIGAINDRLDFDLLLAAANLREVGTLLLVGPVAEEIRTKTWNTLREHPKCRITGGRPHSEIPVWMQGIDVALIPYAKTPLNHACSPMRLFDHLASGKPIVAGTACDQLREYRDVVSCGDTPEAILNSLRAQCTQPAPPPAEEVHLSGLTWESRAQSIACLL